MHFSTLLCFTALGASLTFAAPTPDARPVAVDYVTVPIARDATTVIEPDKRNADLGKRDDNAVAYNPAYQYIYIGYRYDTSKRDLGEVATAERV